MLASPSHFSINFTLLKQAREQGGFCNTTKLNSMLKERKQALYKRIDHVALHVSDLDRSVGFYQQHFGFKKYFQHAAGNGMQIAYLKLGDTVLELTHRPDAPVRGFHFCLETDDFDAAVAQLKNDGLEMAQNPHPTAAREAREKNWRRVVFLGPDGEQIEIRG